MEKKVSRQRRSSINGTRNVLTVKGQEAGYVYRIVNDTGDRIQQLQELGYELVNDVQVGDRRVAVASKEGSPVQVSVGGGMKGYVMRIQKDWYDEDQKAKQARVDELEGTMKADAKNAADYGSLTVK